MESFLVKGLAGRKTLEGVLPVRGAKNSALKAQAACLLFKREVVLRNVPLIEDVWQMNKLLENLGVAAEQLDERSFRLAVPRNLKTDLDEEVARSFRSSVVLAGPLLAREGKVSFPHPGGCVIGQRPIDIFLESFKKMGAKLKETDLLYKLEAKKLKGAEIFFKTPSVTATETLMMAAVLAEGTTVLRNCACEPEVEALAEFLVSAGAEIKGAGTHTIIVRGGELLNDGVFNVPSDRIEAGSFAVIAALCAKKIKIIDCRPVQMGAVLHALEAAGVKIEQGEDFISIKAPAALKAVDIKTREYPGFCTDLQAPFSVFLTQAAGTSLIFETVFENRLNYLNDLERMGANVVVCDSHRAIVKGPTRLRGRKMESPDLRAGLAFLMAGMVAGGNSFIDNVYNIDRGYERIEERLNAVGADISRI